MCDPDLKESLFLPFLTLVVEENTKMSVGCSGMGKGPPSLCRIWKREREKVKQHKRMEGEKHT